MMLLRNKDREALLDIFSSVDASMEVWAYGSRVDGTAHEGSDLDLVVRGQHLQKISFDLLQEIKEKIRESNIPIVVELFDWARLPANFHHPIEARHEVLFSNTGIILNDPPAEYNKEAGEGEEQ